MYEEAKTVYRIYAANVRMVRERQSAYELALEKARAEFEAGKQNSTLRKELIFRRNQAAAALRFYKPGSPTRPPLARWGGRGSGRGTSSRP